MTFKVPESYRAYCTDAAVRTAVDHILDSKSLCLPPDIKWKDLPAFHRAVLSAHQVRSEFAIFLNELWDAVWQSVLDKNDIGKDLNPWKVAEAQRWNDQNFDTNTVWDESWFGRGFDIADTNFQLAPGVSAGTERAWLSLSFWGPNDTDLTTGRNFGDDWPEKDIDVGYAWSSKDLAPIRNDGTIDLVPLRKAATDALDVINDYLPD